MTEERPHALTDRITALEAALTHMEKSLAYRERMLEMRIDTLDARNRGQDQEQEAFAAMVQGKLGEYDKLILKLLAWMATTVGGGILLAALKVLGIGWGG